jgi:phenylpyruvate tautomerase PptA (4-oxalocrotonate tautomerase family)
MPLIYLHCPAETFTAAAKNDMAAELTTLALQVEGLPDTPFVRSTCWIYLHEYAATNVYHGGKPSTTKVISLEVNVFERGLDSVAKLLLIERFTACIRNHAGMALDERAPVYILIRDVPETDWGVFGKTISLKDLHQPPIDAKPI